jgi:hypothetical protein
MQGYLATITSASEQAFVESYIQTDSWLGASDAVQNQLWRWVTGPEGLTNNGQGKVFAYKHWATGEPNDLNGQDKVRMYVGGLWGDTNGTIMKLSYVCEFGGLPSDIPLPYTVSGAIVLSRYFDDAPRTEAPKPPIADQENVSFHIKEPRTLFDVAAPSVGSDWMLGVYEGLLPTDNIVGVLVRIEDPEEDDILTLDSEYSLPEGINISYSLSMHTLNISGESSAAYYYTSVLNHVQFLAQEDEEETRTVSWEYVFNVENNAIFYSCVTNHYYEIISFWSSGDMAVTDCKARSRVGYGTGYLATLTSFAETRVIQKILTDMKMDLLTPLWIGARRDESKSIGYRWVTGPEGNENNGTGKDFEYTSWAMNYPHAGDDCAAYLGGQWVSIPCGQWGTTGGYICEFGGLESDPEPPYSVRGIARLVPVNASVPIPTRPGAPGNATKPEDTASNTNSKVGLGVGLALGGLFVMVVGAAVFHYMQANRDTNTVGHVKYEMNQMSNLQSSILGEHEMESAYQQV